MAYIIPILFVQSEFSSHNHSNWRIHKELSFSFQYLLKQSNVPQTGQEKAMP